MTKRRIGFLPAGCLCILVLACNAAFGAEDMQTQTVEGRTFHLPVGFQLERVAGPPLVNRPICADFDHQGRLYVADSSGSNDNVKTQLKERPHRIVRLEDADGDGRYDKSTVFADRMMFPEGAMWHAGSLYVAAPPSIWKLTDTDDDGVADKREEWFDGKTLTGCANDLHGPYLGPDGWIYWCKGAFAQQTYQRPGRKPLVTRAAHIFRRRPEGGSIEPVMTGGMDNPVEVVFTPGGERLFTTTFLQHPRDGRRDGLIHAIYGGVYGKVHHVIAGHPRTGPVMPVLVHLGAAAPCGLVRLESNELGFDVGATGGSPTTAGGTGGLPATTGGTGGLPATVGGTGGLPATVGGTGGLPTTAGATGRLPTSVLAALFNMRKVTRHVLQPKGATFETRDSDFLRCDDLDFHPTDVLEDADGSVLVVDTGGWYKLCCPTSQLWKPDVLGAIYRVRRTGAHKIADPRGLRIDWPSLNLQQTCDLLDDPRPAVRTHAKARIVATGARATPILKEMLDAKNSATRLHAVWTLCSIDAASARAAVHAALNDPQPQVRQAAIHAVSVWRDKAATPNLIALLKSDSLHNRRAAAEALGRIGDRSAVPFLLSAAGGNPDRTLEHSLIFALIEIADAKRMSAGLLADDLNQQRAALVALDQMPGGTLGAEDVVPLLAASTETTLSEAAWWVVDRHPDWAPALVDHFRARIYADAKQRKPGAQQRLKSQLARFAHHSAIGDLLATALNDDDVDAATKQTLLGAMANSGRKQLPPSWSKVLTSLLSTPSPLIPAAVDTIHAFSQDKLDAPLVAAIRAVAAQADLATTVRLKALAALPRSDAAIDSDVLQLVCDHLSLDRTVAHRSLAVDVLDRAKLESAQLVTLAEALPSTGTMELDRLLAIFERSRDERAGQKLVEILPECSAARAVPPERLKELFAAFGDSVAQRAQPVLATFAAESKKKAKKLESILSLLKSADIRRGQQVFHGTKAACASCHAMGYLGGRVGPDLTRIGNIRSERDLLEAIVFPSASFVRSYESVQIETRRGRIISGIVRDETDKEVILAIDAQKVERIPHKEIAERNPGKISIMPAGLDQQLTPQDLADLIAFLKAAR